jgi:hypothetical protein
MGSGCVGNGYRFNVQSFNVLGLTSNLKPRTDWEMTGDLPLGWRIDQKAIGLPCLYGNALPL